jgi:hypothetical protein
MNRDDSSRLRGSAIAILGTAVIAIAAVAVVLVLMTGSKDQTGQTASQGSTPTEQVKQLLGAPEVPRQQARLLEIRKADDEQAATSSRSAGSYIAD